MRHINKDMLVIGESPVECENEVTAKFTATAYIRSVDTVKVYKRMPGATVKPTFSFRDFTTLVS